MEPHRILRACSDPTRLRILRLLRGGELCVGDLVAILRIPQPTASRHLAYLRRTGLVRAREQGLWAFYSLLPARDPFHRRLLSCVAHAPDPAKDDARARRVRKNGGCCP